MNKEISKEIYYVVLCTERTGSTLLFSLLRNNTLVTKTPNNVQYEPFNYRILLEDIQYKDIVLEKFIQETFECYSVRDQDTKISGFKLFIDQLELFLEKFNTANNKNITVDDFFGYFPRDTKFIRLTRKNRIQQMVSGYKGKYTGKWRHTDKMQQENKNIQVPFNFLKMYSTFIYIQNKEERITKLLSRNSIPVLTLEYETYTQDFEATIALILSYLGTRRDLIIGKVDLQIQRDGNSIRLYQMFSNLYKIISFIKLHAVLYFLYKKYLFYKTHCK